MTTVTTPHARRIHETVAQDNRPATPQTLNNVNVAMVPRQPTPRMVEAGRLAGNGDPAMATAIFAAMMDAAAD